jgi:lysophospholipase L1-like esterase
MLRIAQIIILPVTLIFCSPALAAATSAPATQAAGFEDEIRAFEAADSKQMPPRGAILFAGSSSIRMWTTLAEDFPGLSTINRGFGGSTILDNIRYAPRIVYPYAPGRIVFYAGDNDIAGGRPPERVAGDFARFVEIVREHLPGVRIDFISIKPSIARWKLIDSIREANRLVERYARANEGVGYIDIFSAMIGPNGQPRKELFLEDGLHLNRDGYRLWTSIVGPRIGAKNASTRTDGAVE